MKIALRGLLRIYAVKIKWNSKVKAGHWVRFREMYQAKNLTEFSRN